MPWFPQPLSCLQNGLPRQFFPDNWQRPHPKRLDQADRPRKIPPPRRPQKAYQHELIIGDFEVTSKKTDLSEYFKKMGVDVYIIGKENRSLTYGQDGNYIIINF